MRTSFLRSTVIVAVIGSCERKSLRGKVSTLAVFAGSCARAATGAALGAATIAAKAAAAVQERRRAIR